MTTSYRGWKKAYLAGDLDGRWYKPAEAMRIMGMTKSTFWRRVHDGTIVARRDGPRTYRISAEALLTYLDESRTMDYGE